ncbi:MAG: methyltransferase domain-containing protein [Solirubrobacterales bacterium]|nr:methyltransferase domain-containing protein [Solirubrobacterales bacterium]
MDAELTARNVELPGGPIRLLQPAGSAELPDDGGIEWAPIAPYWSVLWRSGVALAREVAGSDVRGLRVVELGCGLGLPSIAAARGGALVTATDADPEALELLDRNAAADGVELETHAVDWAEPEGLLERGPFDLALAADVLYDPAPAADLTALLPRLASEAWIADPGRAAAKPFIAALSSSRATRTTSGVVTVHRLPASGRRPRGERGQWRLDDRAI